MAKQPRKTKVAAEAQEQPVNAFPFLEAAEDEQEQEPAMDIAKAFPSIDVAEEQPVAKPKRRRASRHSNVDPEVLFDELHADEIVAQEQIHVNAINAINEALAQVFKTAQASKSKDVQAENKTAFNAVADIHEMKAVADRYPNIKAQAKKLTLYSETSAITVEQKKIAFVAPPAKKGEAAQTPVFDDAAADAMVLLAGKNPLMMQKGIKLNGTDEQQAILRAAVDRYNEAHPDAQLKIRGQAPAPVNALNTAAQTQEATSDVKPLETVAQAPLQHEAVAEETQNEAVEKPELKNEKPSVFGKFGIKAVTSKFFKAKPVKAVAEKKVDTKPKEEKLENPSRRGLFGMSATGQSEKKETVVPVVAETPVQVKAENKAPETTASDNDNIVGDIVAKAKPMTRRAVVAGLGAVVATPILTDDAHAFLFRKDPESTRRMLETREKLGLDLKTGKKLERGAQQERKGKNKKPPKGETRKQRLAREKREKAEARQLKREQAAREKKEAREQKQRDREEARRTKTEAREAALNGQVRIVCTHTGATTTLDFGNPRSCQRDFNRVTQDWREHMPGDMAPGLITLLGRMTKDLRGRGHTVTQFNIVAGFRTEKTNEMLIANSKKRNGGKSGVAKHSWHKKGMALDITVAGVSMEKLRNSAKRCGAWSYSAGNFVHMDTRGAYRL